MFNKYPYTDAHQINLDYILKQIKVLIQKVDVFSGDVSDYEQFKAQQLITNNNVQSEIQLNSNRIDNLNANKADTTSVPGTAVTAIKNAQLDIDTPSKTLEAAINYLATLIPNPNVYIAEYGRTQYNDIKAAIDDGRQVMAHRYNADTQTDEYYQLSWWEQSSFATSMVFTSLGYEFDEAHQYPYMINKIKSLHTFPTNEWYYHVADIG